MSQLKTIIQDLINDRSEQAQSTIHQYLVQKMSSLTEAKMSDDGRGHIIGGAKDWLKTIEATPEDLQKAFIAAKKLPSYKALEKSLTDITSAAEARSGTFAFNKDGGEFKSKYRVYAHGQLRSTSQGTNAGYKRAGEKTKATTDQRQFKMKSPQPTVVNGNAYKSILSTYDNAFKELYRTASKTGRIKEDLDQLDEATVSAYKITVPETLFPGMSASKKEDKIFGEDEGDDSFIMNQEVITVEHVKLKGNTLYVYPMNSDEVDMKRQAKLQTAFDRWAKKQ